ncbi:hypothetical protein CR513_11008, partial [Mucuna pruriens]
MEKAKGFILGANGMLRYKDRVCIPQDQEMKKLVLEEGHKSRMSIHPNEKDGMKTKVAKYVIACLINKKAKVEHQRPRGLL